MQMILVIEAVLLCIAFTIMVYILSRLYNYPPEIQERVKALEEYKDRIPTTGNTFLAKIGASIVIVIVFGRGLDHCIPLA